MIYTTEIASDNIKSDVPIHFRLLSAYCLSKEYLKGNLLEIGCGEGRGIEILLNNSDSYLGIDKISQVIEKLKKKYENANFKQYVIPPFSQIEDNSYDTIVSFQVIEHIKDDELFLKEIYRVLKKGGKCIITTPNINKTLSRNPWHFREYTPLQLENICKKYFDNVSIKGVSGDDIVWNYYYKNKRCVDKIMKWDIFNLQYRLPRWILKFPYDILNRINRNNLRNVNEELLDKFSVKNFFLIDNPNEALDLFAILEK